MKYWGILVLLNILTTDLFAQEVTYFNVENKQLKEKERAFYYRKTTAPRRKSKQNFISVKEYYVFNEQLKKDAKYLVIDPTLLDGEYAEYYITGQIKEKGTYFRGDRQEGYTTYHYNGQKASEIYKNDMGKMMIREWDHAGLQTSNHPFFDYEVYTDVEEWPYYLGGQSEFNKFLAQNVKYPYKASVSRVEGKVYVQFIVNHDGSISEIEVIRGIGSGCDEEALRVITLTDQMWRPGKRGGKIVKTKMVVPISFKLQE